VLRLPVSGSLRPLAAISYNPIVHVHLGPLNISPHGVGIAVGFLCGAFLMLPAARARGIDDDTVFALLTRAAIGAIIGARLAYVLNHLSDYGSPLEILQIWKGGISLLGGFSGAIAVALPEMRKRRLSFWKVMDAAAPGMALGVVVGRIGDLIVADHLGKPTSFALGYLCPPAGIETASPCLPGPGAVVHHTALYDLCLTLVLLGLLLLLRRKPRYDGFLILVFGVAYGIQRLVEDFLREDVRHFGLTGSQWTACATGLLCLYALIFRRRTPWWGRWDERPPDGDGADVDDADAGGEPTAVIPVADAAAERDDDDEPDDDEPDDGSEAPGETPRMAEPDQLTTASDQSTTAEQSSTAEE